MNRNFTRIQSENSCQILFELYAVFGNFTKTKCENLDQIQCELQTAFGNFIKKNFENLSQILFYFFRSSLEQNLSVSKAAYPKLHRKG